MPYVKGFLRVQIAPLLEVEGDPGVDALIAKPANPVRMCRSCSAAAFPSCNNPLQCTNVLREVDRSQEWLATQEPIPARNIQQKTDAPVSEVLVLYGRSQPDVDRPGISPWR